MTHAVEKGALCIALTLLCGCEAKSTPQSKGPPNSAATSESVVVDNTIIRERRSDSGVVADFAVFKGKGARAGSYLVWVSRNRDTSPRDNDRWLSSLNAVADYLSTTALLPAMVYVDGVLPESFDSQAVQPLLQSEANELKLLLRATAPPTLAPNATTGAK